MQNSAVGVHLSHGGVVRLVGVQFVLNQLGQGGVVLVLPDRTTDGRTEGRSGQHGGIRRVDAK